MALFPTKRQDLCLQFLSSLLMLVFVVASCGAGLFHERANFTKTHVVFATYPVVDAHNNDVYLRKKSAFIMAQALKAIFKAIV